LAESVIVAVCWAFGAGGGVVAVSVSAVSIFMLSLLGARFRVGRGVTRIFGSKLQEAKPLSPSRATGIS
jgi:hypothetical protein